MNEHERAVGLHYDNDAFAFELERLEKHHPIEFSITLRALARWLPASSGVCVEVGVGSGAYSLWLAARGHKLHLVDVSAKLLEATVQRLRTAGYANAIVGVHHTSATRLETLPAACASSALALGPLYHLTQAIDREHAVSELRRILQPGGVVFAAAINRMAFLRDAIRHIPDKGASVRERYFRFLEDGNLDPATAPPLGHAHLSSSVEFERLFNGMFDKIAFWGIEGFAGLGQEGFALLDGDNRNAWLDLVEATAALPDAIGCADHFLYVGRWNG